jgi:hypothetical protein
VGLTRNKKSSRNADLGRAWIALLGWRRKAVRSHSICRRKRRYFKAKRWDGDPNMLRGPPSQGKYVAVRLEGKLSMHPFCMSRLALYSRAPLRLAEQQRTSSWRRIRLRVCVSTARSSPFGHFRTQPSEMIIRNGRGKRSSVLNRGRTINSSFRRL